MSNIRQVQWNEGAPDRFRAGMILDIPDFGVHLVGHLPEMELGEIYSTMTSEQGVEVTRWAWLIQPHELNWLEDMASRKTRTQE